MSEALHQVRELESPPEGWVKTSLGEVGRFRTSSVDKKSAPGERPVRMVNYMDVYQHRQITRDMPLMEVTAPEGQINSSSVLPGDLLFTPSSETPDDIGHSAVVVSISPPTVHSYHTVRLRPHGQLPVSSEFLSWVPSAAHVRRQLERRATGSTRFTLSLGDLSEVEFLLPPLPEQQKIAEILNSLDDAIAATQRVIDQTERVRKGLLQAVMTRGIGHTRFKQTEIGEIPEAWEVVEVGEVAEVKGGKRMPRGRPFAGHVTPHPYIRVTDFLAGGGVDVSDMQYVLPEDQRQIARYVVASGDVYISIAGTLGLVGVVPDMLDGAQLTENAARIRPLDERLTGPWIARSLRGPQGHRQIEMLKGVGGGVPKLALFRIRGIKIPLPPRREQDAILRVLDGVRDAQAASEIALRQMDREKRGLMQDLLTGRVRVKVA